MNKGTLILSLDFELHWGIFEKAPIEERISYFDNTLAVIPKILELFAKYNIEATWATVGMLFNESLDELMSSFPSEIPNYRDEALSAYKYIQDNLKIIDKYSDFYFAKELINLIHNTKGQEVASHTYSHYYCLESGQTISDFRQDLEININKANKLRSSIHSIVLPRNQYNADYNQICLELGIKSIRSNPNIWFWNTITKETLLKKIARTADCYLPLHNSLFELKSDKLKPEQVLLIPASRFFRPLGKYAILNRLRIRRIKKEMTRAAKFNKLYHLWWHPHNFGTYPKRALEELEELLKHYKSLNEKYNFQSLNMKSIFKNHSK